MSCHFSLKILPRAPPEPSRGYLTIGQRVGPAGSCIGGFRTQAAETLHKVGLSPLGERRGRNRAADRGSGTTAMAAAADHPSKANSVGERLEIARIGPTRYGGFVQSRPASEPRLSFKPDLRKGSGATVWGPIFCCTAAFDLIANR